jgi:hypothetical protein
MPSSFSVVPRSLGCSLACSWPCDRVRSGLEIGEEEAYVVENKEDFSLSSGSCC